MKFGLLALIPALAASVPAYAAEPAAQTPAMDTRCFILASVAMQNVADPEMKQVAMFSSLFFLGRMSAQLSDADMEAAAVAEAKALQTADVRATMTQCGAFMDARGQAISTIGKRIDEAQKAEATAKK